MLTRWFAAPKCSHPENAIQPSIVVLRVPSSFIDYTKTSSSLREIRLTRERERDIREWNNDVASMFWKPRTIETLRRAESSATEEQTAAVAAADNRSRQVPPIANYGTRRPRLMYSTSLFFLLRVLSQEENQIYHIVVSIKFKRRGISPSLIFVSPIPRSFLPFPIVPVDKKKNNKIRKCWTPTRKRND